MEHELEFLRFFYCTADFGPADSDVRAIIREEYEKKYGKKAPCGYGEEE